MSYVSLALAAREECPDLQIVLIDGEHPGTLSLRKVIAAGSADFDFEGRWRSLTQDYLALLIYTSGTTSTPKCVELTHRGLLGNAYGLHEAIGTMRGARVVSCFPYAHLAERMLSHYRAIPGAFEVVCAPSPREIVETVQAVHPHYFFSPPRLFDKLRGVAKKMLADGTTAADILERFGFDQVRVAIAGVFFDTSCTGAVLDRPRIAPRRGLGADRRWSARRSRPTQRFQSRHVRQGATGRGTSADRGRRNPDAEPVHDARLPKPTREDCRGHRCGRVAIRWLRCAASRTVLSLDTRMGDVLAVMDAVGLAPGRDLRLG